MRFLAALLFAFLVTPAIAQKGDLTIEGYVENKPYLVEGKATAIRAKTGSLTGFLVTYRPGSNVESKEDLTPAADGTVSWTPKFAGIARLTATIAVAGQEPKTYSETVSVKFESMLSLGLVVMVLAGAILFGGAFLSIRSLLRADPRPEA